ncbi:hypothetical protein OK349_19050 [Sphingomonas sp. BT-65]|uniref:hypothetical protein n=1 Tax=Sphingomonas sp. BT-65 TaxID=2989821 RepID=UPI0022362CB7|nr:hypothetical protein [Sphingomonas sp. BT-65]MCW4463808.1 hypothetical protein [Sphingomonas sp. BT-65]
MTRIGNVDQILLLLREQLQRAGEGRARSGASQTRAGDRAEQRPLDRARTLASLGAIDPEERRRLIVRTLLLEELDETAGADPAFAALADQVLAMVRDVPGGDELIDRAVRQLGGQD